MIRRVLPMLVMGTLLSSGPAYAQLVPDTVSDEAKEYLRTAFDETVEAPDTLEGWKNLQDQIEEQFLLKSNAVVQKTGVQIDRTTLGGVPVHILTPKDVANVNKEKALIHIHGGGYCLLSAASTRDISATLADLTGLRVYCVDYRLAPQHQFPQGLDDCMAAYVEICKQVDADNLVIVGESAGGGMAMAMTLRMHSEGLRPPAGIVAITPWVDLTLSGETYVTNDELDPVLDLEGLRKTVDAYVGNSTRNDPFVSPLFAELEDDFPATLIQTGTRDLLLSDCSRLHRKLVKHGVDARLTVYEGMWHGFHVIPNTSLPESREAFGEIASFVDEVLAAEGSGRTKP